MEAKASRMSQRSTSSQAKVGKIASKASLTPSQMSERTRLNAAANKDPLDALSRMGTRQTNAEKRSGLQDVDDEYLKTVVYAFSKQTGQTAADRAKVTADMMPAGVPTTRLTNRAPGGTEVGGLMQEQAQAQAQAQTPVPVQQQQVPAQMQLQAQGQQNQPPVQMQAQAPMQKQTPVPVPAQKQPQAAAPAQDAVPSEKPHAAQPEGAAAAQQGGAAQARQGGGGEPELYTTCPNCRATLYLVRNAGEASPYAPQQGGDAAQAQQQQQQ